LTRSDAQAGEDQLHEASCGSLSGDVVGDAGHRPDQLADHDRDVADPDVGSE
jgi:hypothetical protein